VVSVGCGDGGEVVATSVGTETSAATDAGSETEADDGSGELPPEPPSSCVLDDAWRVLEPMAQPRGSAVTLVLPDGTVLVLGGSSPDCGSSEAFITASVERFDPATDAWLPAPDMPRARASHAVLELEGGDVLLVGNTTTSFDASTDRYDPELGTWSSGPELPVALSQARTLANGDLRVVLGNDADRQLRGFRWDDGWQEITPPLGWVDLMAVWPWADSMIVAGAGIPRALIYDRAADTWSRAPSDVAPHPDWESGLSDYVVASAWLEPDTLFVLANTGGGHPEIGQQGVAAMLSVGSDHWIGGAEGPFWRDTAFGTALSFAPGWVLTFDDWTVGDVYDADGDRWCRPSAAPAELEGAVVALGDGSVLFTGGACDDPPLRWTPW
jgi:hypothetical protein